MSLEEWLSAAAAGLWSAAFIAAAHLETPWWAVAPLVVAWGISALLARRTPLLAAALAGATQAAALYLGVPLENPAPLAAALLVAYSCGRFVPDAAGLLALPLLLLPMAAPGVGATPGDALFGAILYGSALAFGWLVRRRFVASARTATAAARLAARDPVHHARLLVEAERLRVAHEALAVIGGSIDEMSSAAERASATLRTGDIAAINAAGSNAVARLKALLVELRSCPAGNRAGRSDSTLPGTAETLPVNMRAASRHTIRQLLPTGIVAVLAAAETAWPMTPESVPGAATLAAVAAALLLRRRSPVWMCLAVAAALGLCVLTGSPLPEGLALAAGCTLAVWHAVADGRRASILGAAPLALVLWILVLRQSPENLAVNFGLLGFSAFAAHAWKVHGQAEQASLTEMEQLQISYAGSFDAALAAGRLELARSIHDAASHAVGAMVMQANAASALAASNPEAARDALALVSRLGEDAAAGLKSLDAELSGQPRHATRDGLQDVIDQVVSAGNPVVVDKFDDVAPHLAPVAYRILRESLYNAARHSPGSTVTLAMAAAESELTVSVVNGPSPANAAAPAHAAAGTGFGLQGLAELVAGAGGTLASGKVGQQEKGGGPASGFQVVAVLPAGTPASPGRRP